MTTPAKDVATWLSQQSGIGTLAGTSGWAIYYSEEPTSPDTVITVYDTPGGTMGNADAQQYDPNIQIRLRGHTYDDVYAKGEAVRDLLVLPLSRTIGQWFYTGFWLISDLAKIGKDANNRHLFTINFRLMREPIPAP
jgi:hypothetical protein